MSSAAAVHDRAWLGRQYNNRALVPDHAQYFARWADASARARASLEGRLDLAYGDAPGERVDFFPASGGDGACMMFIHEIGRAHV